MTVRLGRTGTRIYRKLVNGIYRLCSSCCTTTTVPTTSVPCCPANAVPVTLCVAMSDPGGCFDGLSFPIHYDTTLGTGCTWTSYGTPPTAVGCADWYNDNDGGAAICYGYFHIACVQNPFTLIYSWTILAISGDYCDFIGITLVSSQCSPFQLVFTVTTANAAGGVHGCPGAASRTVTITVTETCPAWPALTYLRACPAGVPTTLTVAFTLTSGVDGCGLNGYSQQITYQSCTFADATTHICTEFFGSKAITLTVSGSPTACLVQTTLRVSTAGVLTITTNIISVVGGTLICNSQVGAVVVTSCSPLVLTIAGQFFGGAFCPCNGLAGNPRYLQTVMG